MENIKSSIKKIYEEEKNTGIKKTQERDVLIQQMMEIQNATQRQNMMYDNFSNKYVYVNSRKKVAL